MAVNYIPPLTSHAKLLAVFFLMGIRMSSARPKTRLTSIEKGLKVPKSLVPNVDKVKAFHILIREPALLSNPSDKSHSTLDFSGHVLVREFVPSSPSHKSHLHRTSLGIFSSESLSYLLVCGKGHFAPHFSKHVAIFQRTPFGVPCEIYMAGDVATILEIGRAHV